MLYERGLYSKHKVLTLLYVKSLNTSFNPLSLFGSCLTGLLKCIRCPHRFWSNSNHTACIPQQVDFLSFNDTMGVVLSILSGVGAALTAATFVTFLYHRHTPLVKCNIMVSYK